MTITPLHRLILTFITVTYLSGCDWAQRRALDVYMAVNQNLTVADGAKRYQSERQEFTATAIAEGFKFPWDLHFISNNQALLTEKPGRLWRLNVETGDRFPISGVPAVAMHGQGGLLGVVADPAFASNQKIYLSYSIATAENAWTTRLASATLADDKLTDIEVLFTATPATGSGNHFGGAMIFDAAGFLYLSIGDRGNRHFAQQLDASPGKIMRFHPDGRTPADNPFINIAGAQPQIWSYGHRNPQGLSIDPTTGTLWEAEHGPQGGDEINIILRGRNYGWPLITYGEEYGGGKIGQFEQAGLEQPIHHYIPSIATAGLLYYADDLFPAWRDSVFVAGLRSTSISRVSTAGGRADGDERLFEDLSMRMRGLESGPDGSIYVITENGAIFRLRPATKN